MMTEEMHLWGGEIEPMSPPPTFDEWWAAYPRKQGKAEAAKRWAKMSAPERASAWIALHEWLPYWAAENRPQFVPYGSTWLNQERWLDTVPPIPQPERREAPGMAAVRRVLGS